MAILSLSPFSQDGTQDAAGTNQVVDDGQDDDILDSSSSGRISIYFVT